MAVQRRMGSRMVLALAALLLLSAMLPRASSAWYQTPVVLPPTFFGMVARDPFYDWNTDPKAPGEPNRAAQEEMGRRLEEMGVVWVRIEFLSEYGENAQVDFRKYDYFVREVAPRHSLKILGLLATNLVRGDRLRPDGKQEPLAPEMLNLQPTSTDPRYGSGVNDYMRRWLDAALRVAEHYDGQVAAWELFNEANRILGDGTGLPDYTKLGYGQLLYAGLDPLRLGRLHAKFYRLCKNTDGSQASARCTPETKIILGGLHPKGTSNRRSNANNKETFAFTDRAYLRAMYGAGGFLDFKNYLGNLPPWQGQWPVDGIGYHPYPEEIDLLQSLDQDMQKIQRRLTDLRNTLISIGDSHAPFWITEIGFNVGFYANRGPGAADAQARFLYEIYTRLWNRGDIDTVFWFKYEDFPPADVVFDRNGNPVTDPQRWGVVQIPFREGGTVNGSPCAGGACYEPTGQPKEIRPAYFVYRQLAGLPVRQTYLPYTGR